MSSEFLYQLGGYLIYKDGIVATGSDGQVLWVISSLTAKEFSERIKAESELAEMDEVR